MAADSLAAESTESGGGFSENRNSEPMKVKGANSTLANDDTSAARTIPPTGSASSSDDTAPSSTGFSGSDSAQAAGGQSTTSDAANVSGSSGAGTAQQSSDDSVDTAPTYVTNYAAEQTSMPKGENITEGGFDSEQSNTSTGSMPAPGSEDDPGRVSLQGIQNTQAATVGSGPRQGEITGDGQYDTLDTDQNLE